MTQPPSTVALGKAIRERRMRVGLTQVEVAARAGTHPAYLSSIEAGRENPSWRLLGAIAQALETTIADLAAHAQRAS